MKVDYHAQPIDPNKAQAESKTQYKQCIDCMANLPMSHYGLAKISKSGRSNICHQCRAQYLRLKRKEKHGCRSQIDDSVIRSVKIQNARLIELGLAQSTIEMVAFEPLSKRDYKVVFGKAEISGMRAVSIFSMDGEIYRELSYSGQTRNVVELIFNMMKTLGLRLELSPADAQVSKALIYIL